LPERCYNCIAFIHCGGGCPLKNKDARHLSKEEIYYSEIECENKKQYWRMIIEESMKNNIPNEMQLKTVAFINGKKIFKLVAKGE
jgi:sulfatase maturation enzyme AslB (radical SAM superfamily)